MVSLYCELIDDKSGLVRLGVGCSEEYYRSIGMKKRNVEQSEIDAEWYITEKCPHYTPEEIMQIRQANFLSNFFKVNLGELGDGYYRKKPKGYQSAIESINTAQIICSKLNGLPAGVLIFYKQPTFSKPEQCTEEWLVAHQIVIPALTVEQFDELYLSFIQSWNKQEHE